MRDSNEDLKSSGFCAANEEAQPSRSGLHAGYDVQTPDPGKHESMTCRVCGQVMLVERNVEGARGFAQAMSGGKSRFDRFTCPSAGIKWHSRAIQLLKESKDTASDTIAGLILADLHRLLASRGLVVGTPDSVRTPIR